jgi:hypothetical protein
MFSKYIEIHSLEYNFFAGFGLAIDFFKSKKPRTARNTRTERGVHAASTHEEKAGRFYSRRGFVLDVEAG